MTTIWEVPVATDLDIQLGMSRRLLRVPSRFEVLPPRDARPTRARRERLPLELRARAAGTWGHTVE